MILVAYILAFINLKINVQRIKGGKLVSVISWLIILGFGCLHFMDIAESDDFLGVMLVAEPYTPNIVLLIIEGIILLVINFLTIKNKFKAIILTLSQLGASVVVVAAVILIICGLFMGGSSNSTQTVSNKKYTDEENQYAKANGYYDAESANNMGFDTSDANSPGFDYTQKKN